MDCCIKIFLLVLSLLISPLNLTVKESSSRVCERYLECGYFYECYHCPYEFCCVDNCQLYTCEDPLNVALYQYNYGYPTYGRKKKK
ncbi:UNVERIFIED_CONTAM: hypothetical protein RMT77_005497 [Armadillidium vulgare]